MAKKNVHKVGPLSNGKKIIAMYAKGLTTRQLSDKLKIL